MLCVAVKRRIQLLHYDGSDFVELKEVAVAHSPTAMQWLGGNAICVVFKSQ
jgi:CNH domain